jgi:predicted ATP-binding protein involved in virulence
MQIKNLTLTQFRGFEQAKIDFYPGMNLLVGINGVGKSTILDALRIMLSQVLPKFTVSKSRAITFDKHIDIKADCGAFTSELKFDLKEVAFTYLVHQAHSNQVEHSDLQPDVQNISKQLKTISQQPLVVYFSTRRSLSSMAAPNKLSGAGGQVAAFADALTHRELRLREFADWWLAQEALVNEGEELSKKRLKVLNETVKRFLDSCTNLYAVSEPEITLKLDKDGVTLDVRQLSDGERGVLALVLDLARRLSQANPNLEDPLSNGKAVVLIDELDLHLHPRWQRTIVQKLTQTFPSCQFIATTHSPQIIGEVKPPGLILLEKQGSHIIVRQKGLQGYGLDSSWILEHLMDTESRNVQTQSQINLVEDAIEEGALNLARTHLAHLQKMIYGSDNEVIRLEASINNLEALAYEMDSEEE